MPRRRPIEDPYRTLGVLPGADGDAIKAAHRRLAKRFHPDGSMGDEGRFLAIQEAYQLLSDPVRRRQWDGRHASGPLPVREPAPRTARRRGSRAGKAPAQPSPGERRTTWSAEDVPWWQDFQPGDRADAEPRAPSAHDSARPVSAQDGAAPASDGGTMDFDVFSRSSGAAWSMAARRHFRRGDEELPSRGAWRYRGTQVVTGALARQLAEEEAAEQAAHGATDRATGKAAASDPPRGQEPTPR